MVRKEVTQGITLLLIFTVIAVTVFSINTELSAFSGSNFDVLSISHEEVISEGVSRFKLLLAVGGEDTIVASIKPFVFERETGFVTESPVEITASDFTEQLLFDIQRGDLITLLDYEVLERPLFGSVPSCNAERTVFYEATTSVAGVVTAKHCVYRDNLGVSGSVLSTPDRSFSVELSVEADGFSVTKELNSIDRVAVFSRNGVEYARADYQGQLVLNSDSREANIIKDSGAVLLGTNLLGSPLQWVLVRQGAVDAAVDKLQSTRSSLSIAGQDRGLSVFEFEEKLSGLVDEHNREVNRLLVNNRLSLTSNLLIRSDDDKLIYEQPINSLRPVITFDVRAEAVTTKENVGVPVIEQLSCPIFSSSSEGIIVARITNDGRETGSFVISLDGCPSIKPTKTVSVQLLSGASRVIEYPISLIGENVAVRERCLLSVVDEVSQRSDSGSVVCETEKERLQCVAGEQSIIDNCIYKCNSDSTGLDLQQCCEFGVKTASNGELVCNEESGAGCKWYDLACIYANREQQCNALNIGCHINTFLTPLRNIALFFFPIITFLLFTAYLREEGLLKRRNDLLIAGVASGIVMFLLVWFYFNIALIVLTLIFLFRLLLKSVKPL